MTNKAQIGGIFTIISGAFGFLYLLWFIFEAVILRIAMSQIPSSGSPPPRIFLDLMTVWFILIGLFFAGLGALGIVGGVFALRKEHWGWALAGAIAGDITFLPLGVASVIFISMAKNEFDAAAKPPAEIPPAPATIQ